MKSIIMIGVMLILLSACVNPLEQEYLQQKAGIPMEHRGIAKYRFPNLTGFEPVKDYGISWDCINSSWSIDGHLVQVATSSGENLIFVCNLENEPMVRFCPQGVIISPPGEHDKCR